MDSSPKLRDNLEFAGRDSHRNLLVVNETVTFFAFRGIFEMLDLMKLDMANFTIATMRPAIQQHSVEYERGRFAKFLETNPSKQNFCVL